MTTKTATRTISINANKTAKVTLERGTWEDEIRLDGTLCGAKTCLVNRTKIILLDGGKQVACGDALDPLPKQHPQLQAAIKAGCVGRIGRDWFVKAETAEAIRKALAEVEAENPKTAEMIELERKTAESRRIGEENLARIEAEQRERERHPDWCKRCQDYTYGDCGHN